MRFVGSALDIMAAVTAYFLLVAYIRNRYQLNITFKSRKVLLIGTMLVFSTAMTGYVRLYDEDVGVHILAVGILGISAALSVCDWEIHTVPNTIIIGSLLFWIAVAGIYVILFPAQGLVLIFRSVIGGIIAGLIFFLCYFFSRHQLGAGDVKYAVVLGLCMTGERVLGCILYGTLCCCIFSLVQVCRKKITLHDGVALIPFLYLGIIITFMIM
ncbi:MAG: prepilin peptidase [Alistipes sp.]|nr:prepilin peptidase [Alistipes sp.]